MDAALGAAGDDGVGVAATDELGRLPERVRAGGAGRDDRVVGAAEAELDRELPARGVDEDVGEEGRGDAVGPALAQDVVLAHELVEAADAVADDHAQALGLEAVAVHVRVGQRLLGGA